MDKEKLEKEIGDILFQIGQDIDLHQVNGHIILDINYQKYINQIIDIFIANQK